MDLEELCARQKEEILRLREELDRRERLVQTLRRVAKKYSSVIPELGAHSSQSLLDDSADYWGWQPAATSNFESIAAKGLWVVSCEDKKGRGGLFRDSSREKPTSNTESAPSIAVESTENTPQRSLLRPRLVPMTNVEGKKSLQRIAEFTLGKKRNNGFSVPPTLRKQMQHEKPPRKSAAVRF